MNFMDLIPKTDWYEKRIDELLNKIDEQNKRLSEAESVLHKYEALSFKMNEMTLYIGGLATEYFTRKGGG